MKEGRTVRIAIASENGQVAQHFGKCPEYVLFDVADGQVEQRSLLPNPGHEPGVLPGFLASHGVNCIVAGGMGPRAIGLFRQCQVDVVTGAEGDVDAVIAKYIDGTLDLGDTPCEHHE